jgi:cytochrome P450
MWPNQKEVKKDSWRPFEKGPRACIGQELAMLEMEIIMVMTLRDFDVNENYAEWERKIGRRNLEMIWAGREICLVCASKQICRLC